MAPFPAKVSNDEGPVVTGLLLFTRSLYPLPTGVALEIVPMIMPEDVAVSVPIFWGAAKEPAASDNCSVNTFPAAKPNPTKPTWMVSPLHLFLFPEPITDGVCRTETAVEVVLHPALLVTETL